MLDEQLEDSTVLRTLLIATSLALFSAPLLAAEPLWLVAADFDAAASADESAVSETDLADGSRQPLAEPKPVVATSARGPHDPFSGRFRLLRQAR